MVPAAAFAVLLPLCIYTFAETGQFAPGSKGSGNFLLGPAWKDSKAVYSSDGPKTRTYGETFRALPRQVAGNVHDVFRLANEQLFTRGLRMGTIWFALLAAGLIGGLARTSGKTSCFGGLAACLAGAQLFMMSLAFVHDRILAPTLPWLALLGMLGAREWGQGWGRGSRIAAASVFGLYCIVCAMYAVQVWRTEFAWWRYGRVGQLARDILSMGMEEKDVVMHYGPQLAIETHRDNPLLTVEVPYGSIEDVGRVAMESGVRFTAISDAWRGHWPIARIFDDGVAPPEGWALKKELIFEADEEHGVQAERIRIYEIDGNPVR